MIDKINLTEIKKTLPPGSYKRIQKKAGVSYLTVVNFFNGKSQNTKVVKATIKLLEEHNILINTLKTLAETKK